MPTIILKPDRLLRAQERAGIPSLRQLAAAIHVAPGNLSLVMRGKAQPGNRFIAGVLDVFGMASFSELFEIGPDE